MITVIDPTVEESNEAAAPDGTNDELWNAPHAFPLDEKLTSVNPKAPNRPPWGKRGPVSNDFKSILVLDENGDEVILYEFRETAFFGLLVRKRYELCTGEAVKSAGKGFVVVATDEKLTRVSDAS